jgi:cytochrome P450 family 114
MSVDSAGQLDVMTRLMGEEGRDDPYPIYSWLREHAPVYRSTFGAVLLSRYEDCLFVLKNTQLFRGADDDELAEVFPQATKHPAFAALVTSLVGSSPPKHTRLRHLVGRDFTPRRVAGLQAGIERFVDRLLDEIEERLAGGEAVDLHRTVSVAVPLHVFAELVGIPEADRALLAVEVPRFVKVVNPMASPEVVAAADVAIANLGRCFDDLIAERRKRPREDLVSALVTEHDAETDRLSDVELRNLLYNLCAAGFDTTATAIDNAILTLLRYPESVSWLDTPAGTEAFLDEVVRFEAPVQIAPGIRFAARDVEIAGQSVAAGTQIRLILGSALRDPAAYPDPDRFDPSRDGPPSLSFGAGIHYCLGTHLAKLEMAILLPALHRRLPGLKLAEPPQRGRSMLFRGFKSLTVRN